MSGAGQISPCRPPSATRAVARAQRRRRVFDVVHRCDQPHLTESRSSPRNLGSWLSTSDRDLTGFIDGTRSPHALRGHRLTSSLSAGAPGAARRSCSCSEWEHDTRYVGGASTTLSRPRWGAPRPTHRADSSPDHLPRRPHRPGHLRRHLPAQHGLRNVAARHDVRRLLREQRPLRRCSRAWPASTGPATRSPATRARSPARTTWCPRRTHCSGLRLVAEERRL